MELFKPGNLQWDWVSKFKFGFVVSAIISALGIISFFAPGLNYGVDFRGGIEARINFKDSSVTDKAIRESLDGKLENLGVVKYEGTASANTNEFSITTQNTSKDEAQKILNETLTQKYGPQNEAWSVSSFDAVGPRVSMNLRQTTLLSIIYTFILITLYMYWRFDLRYSPGALACIFHDLTAAIAFIAFTGTEFSTTIVAALLTLAGYSINDTVVVYDRIREVEHKYIGKSKNWIVNEAINSTLSRTILTSGTTIVCCIVLYLLGGPAIQDFALVLLVGIIVGTYSSAFVAAPLYIWADKKFASGEKNASSVA